MIVLLLSGCAHMANMIVLDNVTKYKCFIDTLSGKPYSQLFEEDSIAYMVQFPGYNPNESFLYDTDYVANLFVGAKGKYSIRNLWLSVFNKGLESIPYRSSYISDKAGSRRETKFIIQSYPPRELDYDYTYQALVGFSFLPKDLKDTVGLELVITFDLFEGDRQRKIEQRFKLSRSIISQNAAYHPLMETDIKDSFLWGPWWLGWGVKSPSESIREYNELIEKSKTDSKTAFRLTGRTFLPCLRYDHFHQEGFFMHMDR